MTALKTTSTIAAAGQLLPLIFHTVLAPVLLCMRVSY